jgi:hypothetical protein
MTDYTLSSFDETTGQLIVSFKDYSPISIDIPIEAGAYLSGDNLHAYIKGFIPVWDIERKALVSTRPTVPPDLAGLCMAYLPEPEPTYDALRAKEYPPVTDFIDGMVKGDSEQMQAYIDLCLAIKAKYPKPIPELVSEEVLASRREL